MLRQQAIQNQFALNENDTLKRAARTSATAPGSPTDYRRPRGGGDRAADGRLRAGASSSRSARTTASRSTRPVVTEDGFVGRVTQRLLALPPA